MWILTLPENSPLGQDSALVTFYSRFLLLCTLEPCIHLPLWLSILTTFQRHLTPTCLNSRTLSHPPTSKLGFLTASLFHGCTVWPFTWNLPLIFSLVSNLSSSLDFTFHLWVSILQITTRSPASHLFLTDLLQWEADTLINLPVVYPHQFWFFCRLFGHCHLIDLSKCKSHLG